MFQRVLSCCIVAMTASCGFASDSRQPVRRRSLTALQSEVKSLHVKKVAWRKIAWKTCLLEGLKASREQKKPLMLWIFIDRPIDDERC